MCRAAAILMGALWAAIPGVLKARFGSHEVINIDHVELYRRCAGQLLHSISLQSSWRSHFCQASRLVTGRTLRDSASSFRVWPERIPLNLAFLLAPFSCLLVYVFLWRNQGKDLRDQIYGSNPSAGQEQRRNLDQRNRSWLAMVVSGAVGFGTVGIQRRFAGYRYRYYDGFPDNYGFTGIAVALLGRNHPVGVILAALLFAVLQHGGGIYVDGFSEHVTKDIVQVLQGIIILFVAAEGFFKYVSGRLRLKHNPQRCRR